jgi:hypothetical protein
MEAGFIRFDPATEFEVIESIDFDEEVARPESLRFFTLDEQLSDYFDKSLPSTGKVTKFEYTKLSNEVDRLRDIYENIITATDSDYEVISTRKAINVDWVNPIYSDVELIKFPYASNWLPLYTPEFRSIANYYPRMITSLPKPYKSVGQQGVAYLDGGILVDSDGNNPIHTLPLYQRTKGVVHEDGSFTVINVPLLNTADDVKAKGFYIKKRPFDIPNPRSDHPFFASNEPSRFITNEPLLNVFPTIEAIMNHGIPRTSDPYGEGRKMLKIYDLTLSQIPWNLWKEHFPPVDTISTTPTIMSVDFSTNNNQNQPSKNLQDIYLRKWLPGIEPRFWLSKQEDNGNMVIKMILSNASSAGLLPPAVMSEKPVPTQIESTPEECFNIENFETFLSSGIYRSPAWDIVNNAVDKHKAIPAGMCIPIPQIFNEKADILVGNKTAWKETTDDEILKEHQQLLKYFQFPETPPKPSVFEKYTRHSESDTRRQILAVLHDDLRLPKDKADGIEKILRGSTFKNNLYFDSLDIFLICGHTLSELRGELEDDSTEYYEKWATTDEGFHCCKSCGERIGSGIYVSQDDFDENGNAIITHEAIGSSHGDVHVAVFTSSIQKLQTLFNLENVGELVLYVLISLIQVLPAEEQLVSTIQIIRNMSAGLRGAKGDAVAKERTEGILGIVGMAMLLLTHNPFLIPRRSFGSKVLKLTGFPRDTLDEKDAPALDTIISILKTTFESSPSTFKGSVAKFLRYVISSHRKVRDEAIKYLGKVASIPKFKPQFQSAKERYTVPSNTTIINQLILPVVRVDNPVYAPTENNKEEYVGKCGVPSPKTSLTGKLPPNLVQEPVTLSKTNVSNLAKFLKRSYESPKLVSFTEADIRRRVALGFPKMKSSVMDKINTFLKSDTDGISLLALLNRLLDVLSAESFSLERLAEYRRVSVFLDTTKNKSLLRDSVKGIIYELLHEVHKDYASKLATAIQRDLVFNMILLTRDQASKQETDLRTRERDVFKQRMRQLNDTEREVTKMLLDIGIAPYIITNEDREIFAREYKIPDPEIEHDELMKELGDNPEDGFFNPSQDRDDGEPNVVGSDDYGAFTDNVAERYNRDYENFVEEDDGGYGVV